MRVLVYGFGPYRRFRDNITARVIKSLPEKSDLRTEVFPVQFRRRQFIDALNRHQPDVILGLGQCSRKQIDIETRARNRRREGKGAKLRLIFSERPKSLPTTLTIRAGHWVGRSINAGDYVCNFSMYVVLDEIARRHLTTLFGFVHIPHDYDPQKARRFVERSLKQCLRLAANTNGD
ncbi:MAG: hypothetical protein ACREOR_09210 [Candidatus Binatia bacterium]